MRVKVSAPVQVVHRGEKYTINDIADVPDHVAHEWIRQGWATEPKPAPPRKRRSAAK
jgi:hypothetical protein